MLKHCFGAGDDHLVVVDGDVGDEQPDVSAAHRDVFGEQLRAQHGTKPFDRFFVDPACPSAELACQTPFGFAQGRDRSPVLCDTLGEDRLAGIHDPLFDQLKQSAQPRLGRHAFAADAVEIGLATLVGHIRPSVVPLISSA